MTNEEAEKIIEVVKKRKQIANAIAGIPNKIAQLLTFSLSAPRTVA